METPPLKASFSIFEINKFGAGTQFSYLFLDVPIPKCMRENTVNFGHFNIISKLAGSKFNQLIKCVPAILSKIYTLSP